MKKITINIKATFGSKCQEKNAIKALKWSLKAWKLYELGHRKNKIEIEFID